MAAILYYKGFFTTVGWLKGRTLQEIESLLGFQRDRLNWGARVYIAFRLPQIDEFELAGYSQVASHQTQEQYGSNLNSPQNKSEMDAYKVKKGLAMSCWAMSGKDRIVKILPAKRHSDLIPDAIQYPPGQGIPQWKFNVVYLTQS
jgi:hypothetical protein